MVDDAPSQPSSLLPRAAWDRTYGNGDGVLSEDEQSVARVAEHVLADATIDVTVKAELRRLPLSPFRAGVAWRDEFGAAQVRIFPGAARMSPALVAYVTAHELAHVKLAHIDGDEHGPHVELEAEHFAGRVLAELGEDLSSVVAALQANGADTGTHGTLQERIDAVTAGYSARRAELASTGPVVPMAPSAADGLPLSPLPAPLEASFDALAQAFDAFLATRRQR